MVKELNDQNTIDFKDVLTKGMPEYERIERLRKQVVDATSYICIERARIITDFYKQNKCLPTIELRTLAFKKILENISVYILPDELIVGHQSSKHRSAPLFPEFAVEWIKEEIDLFSVRSQDRFIVTDDVKKEFLEEIYPYWKGRTISDKILHYMTEDIRLQRFDAGIISLGIHEEGGLGHVLLDFKKLLSVGLKGIICECKEHIAMLKNWDTKDMCKKMFYEGCIITCEALITFAHRYSALADDMAKKEKNEKRKLELAKIAKVCNCVPEYPAQTLQEALQSTWFLQLCIQIYDNSVAISMGRIDQIFYPYYIKEIENRSLSKVQTQELLTAFFIKFAEPIKVYPAEDAAIHAGYPMGQNVCVGGIDANGIDVTNDLSYRFLEAHRHVRLGQPNFSARVHLNSPYDYLRTVTKTIKCGSGMPQIVNDEVFIPALQGIGVPLKEARDYGIIGCIEGSTTNVWGRTNGGYFNIAKYVELALNNGVCRLTGKQVGPKTGNPRKFSSFNEVIAAYTVQVEYGFNLLATWNNVIDVLHEQLNPVPIVSMFIGDCLKKGKDVTSGGARYNWTAPLGVGIADTGNSLYAVKKAVFEDKKYTMKELVDALDVNFEGYELMQMYLKNKVGKYGNDLIEVDDITQKAMGIFFDAMLPYKNHRGGPFVASLLPVASYVLFGHNTGALPSGRNMKEPLADGISPSNGTDKNGPTAVFKSVTKIDHVRCPNGVILNQKFSPMIFDGENGVDKFISLIQSYIRLGGGHVQFNILSADTLRDAQKNPQKYAGLVVRVAGYSAFFNELSKEVQDTIIERTEQNI